MDPSSLSESFFEDSLTFGSNGSAQYLKSDSPGHPSDEITDSSLPFEKVSPVDDGKDWSLEQMETVSLVEDEQQKKENLVILDTVSFEHEAEVLERDPVQSAEGAALNNYHLVEPNMDFSVIGQSPIPNNGDFCQIVAHSTSDQKSGELSQNSAMLASYYVEPTVDEINPKLLDSAIDSNIVDIVANSVSALNVEEEGDQQQPMISGVTETTTENTDLDHSSQDAPYEYQQPLPDVAARRRSRNFSSSAEERRSSTEDISSSTIATELSKLFTEDKFGSDKAGKAFFDALAQTISVPVNLGYASNSGTGESATGKTSDEQSGECYDIWIPKQITKQVLDTVALSPPGTYFAEKEHLTMPGVIITEDLRDPIRDLVRNYLGDQAAAQRVVLTADSVSQDEEGLLKLVSVGCYRAAVNLTTRLLTIHGQGLKKSGHPSRNSPQSLHLWLVRLTLLCKLRLFNMAEAESEPFGDLDHPDLYYEFYPDIYGSRRGTMVPFSLRLLLPQILTCVGKFGAALDRLFTIQHTVKKIIEHLEKGLLECSERLSTADLQSSVELWRRREVKVMYGIANYLVAQNDYYSAYSVLENILMKTPDNVANVRSAQGHIFLHLGDVKSAQASFSLAAAARGEDTNDKVANLIDKAMVIIANNNFNEAHNILKEAHDLDPENPVVVNNMAVCLLYTGKLRRAFQLLENAISGNPKLYVHECILVNICTLYDLESSRSLQKKSSILDVVSQHAGDGFNVFCLKLQNAS